MIYFNKKVTGYRTGASIIGCYLGNNVILALLSTVHMGAVCCQVTVPRKMFNCQFLHPTRCSSDVSLAEKMYPDFGKFRIRVLRVVKLKWGKDCDDFISD